MEEFSRWTMREVDIALVKCSVRRHNAIAMRAALQGIQVERVGEEPELTKEDNHKIAIDDKKAEDVMEAALRRKREEILSGTKR